MISIPEGMSAVASAGWRVAQRSSVFAPIELPAITGRTSPSAAITPSRSSTRSGSSASRGELEEWP